MFLSFTMAKACDGDSNRSHSLVFRVELAAPERFGPDGGGLVTGPQCRRTGDVDFRCSRSNLGRAIFVLIHSKAVHRERQAVHSPHEQPGSVHQVTMHYMYTLSA